MNHIFHMKPMAIQKPFHQNKDIYNQIIELVKQMIKLYVFFIMWYVVINELIYLYHIIKKSITKLTWSSEYVCDQSKSYNHSGRGPESESLTESLFHALCFQYPSLICIPCLDIELATTFLSLYMWWNVMVWYNVMYMRMSSYSGLKMMFFRGSSVLTNQSPVDNDRITVACPPL